MEELLTLAFQQHAWGALFAVLGLWLLSLALNLVLAKRTQIDAWCETRPRLAGALKILRGFGLDPWAIGQGLSLLFAKKLPEYQKQTIEGLRAKKTAKPPILPIFMLAWVLGCLVLMASACRETLPAKYAEKPCDPATIAAMSLDCNVKAYQCGESGVEKLDDCPAYKTCFAAYDARKKACTQ